jgi:apolipoprotein N-acyltransferase
MKLSVFFNQHKTVITVILSSLLLFLSFPKYGIGLLAWFALIPFFYSIEEKSLFKSMVTGFSIGMLFHIGLIYWIVFVTVVYGYYSYYVAFLLMILLAAYLSIYFALFAAGIVYLRNNSIPFIVSAPILWVVLEYIKSNVFTGFPWENLAYSQYLYNNIIQIVDILGGYGLSFIIVLLNVIAYDLLTNRNEKSRISTEIVIGISLLIFIFFYGEIRAKQVQKAINESPAMKIDLVQGNIDQSIKWSTQYQKDTIDIYQTLTLASRRYSVPGMIIWPETAVPFYFQNESVLKQKIISLALQTGNWLLFGSPSYIDEQGNISFLNTAFLLSPNGDVVAQYNKVHLVPYGEYVPLRRFFPFIGKLAAGVGDFKAGDGFIPIRKNGEKIGVLICYEGILPEAGRTYKKNGASLLVNITNDAWFGDTSAPYQHLSMTVFRAVENKVFLARAANTGISAIVDPTGKILRQSRIFERTIVHGEIKYLNIPTYYAKYGDIFVYLCFILLIIIYFISIKRRKVKCLKIFQQY